MIKYTKIKKVKITFIKSMKRKKTKMILMMKALNLLYLEPVFQKVLLVHPSLFMEKNVYFSTFQTNTEAQ